MILFVVLNMFSYPHNLIFKYVYTMEYKNVRNAINKKKPYFIKL